MFKCLCYLTPIPVLKFSDFETKLLVKFCFRTPISIYLTTFCEKKNHLVDFFFCTDLKNELLMSFSLISNIKKMVSTSATPKGMECLNGIRVISIAWVILGHTYVTVFAYTSKHSLSCLPFLHTFASFSV